MFASPDFHVFGKEKKKKEHTTQDEGHRIICSPSCCCFGGTLALNEQVSCASIIPCRNPNPDSFSSLKKIRQASPQITDADILNYALTLEHLEDKFYRDGLDNYTQGAFASAGFDATFYGNLKTISSDETTHVSFLTAALIKAGATPVKECIYSFGVDNPKDFVALSSVLEGVGVTAYLGAAAEIASAAYLTAAGSILTVESRHSAYIRAALGESPFPTPFDVPLTLDEVYTLAAPFIVSCPDDNPKLPVKVCVYFFFSSSAFNISMRLNK